MGTTCKDNLKICYCLETNNSTNIDKVQNIESRLLQFGDFLEDRQFNEKIPEQIQNFITENKFSPPNNLNINENIYLIRPLLLNNGNIYKGNWNENIQKHGYGEYYIEKEKKFIEGIWYNDRITYGRIFYPNNDLYEGYIDNFLPNGKGKIFFSSGNKYKGDFKEGKREGTGKYIFSDKTIYNGKFKNNKFDGKGILEWTNNIKYEGEFSEGYLNNEGKLADNEGEKYEGNFKNNCFEGKGKYTFEDGSTYEGSFSSNYRFGKGVFIKSNDEFMFEGNWVNDYPNGSGTFTKGNTTIEGTWRNGANEKYSIIKVGQSNEFNENDLNFNAKIPNINLIPTRLPHMNKN